MSSQARGARQSVSRCVRSISKTTKKISLKSGIVKNLFEPFPLLFISDRTDLQFTWRVMGLPQIYATVIFSNLLFSTQPTIDAVGLKPKLPKISLKPIKGSCIFWLIVRRWPLWFCRRLSSKFSSSFILLARPMPATLETEISFVSLKLLELVVLDHRPYIITQLK
jgi:hypothetical protein